MWCTTLITISHRFNKQDKDLTATWEKLVVTEKELKTVMVDLQKSELKMDSLENKLAGTQKKIEQPFYEPLVAQDIEGVVHRSDTLII